MPGSETLLVWSGVQSSRAISSKVHHGYAGMYYCLGACLLFKMCPCRKDKNGRVVDLIPCIQRRDLGFRTSCASGSYGPSTSHHRMLQLTERLADKNGNSFWRLVVDPVEKQYNSISATTDKCADTRPIFYYHMAALYREDQSTQRYHLDLQTFACDLVRL